MNIDLNAQKDYSWNGFRDFTVYKKAFESEDIISLYLKPNDEMGLAKIKAGQFIGIKIKTDNEDFKKVIRMYSLSSSPSDDFYRVTIKIVENGKMTNYLKDNIEEGSVLEVMKPRGNFYLEKTDIKRPVVLLGGGIGVTPVYSMLQHINDDFETYFIYSLRNKNSKCFLNEINSFKNSKNTKVHTFFTRPLENEILGQDFDYEGRIDKEWIENNLPLNADFYFCGNKGFTETLKEILQELGVQEDRINFEFF